MAHCGQERWWFDFKVLNPRLRPPLRSLSGPKLSNQLYSHLPVCIFASQLPYKHPVSGRGGKGEASVQASRKRQGGRREKVNLCAFAEPNSWF